MFRSFRDFVPETLCLGRVTRFWTHTTLIVAHIVSISVVTLSCSEYSVNAKK